MGPQAGGKGQPGENSVIRAHGAVEVLQGNDEAQMGVGDIFVLKSPGGGGYGKG